MRFGARSREKSGKLDAQVLLAAEGDVLLVRVSQRQLGIVLQENRHADAVGDVRYPTVDADEALRLRQDVDDLGDGGLVLLSQRDERVVRYDVFSVGR